MAPPPFSGCRRYLVGGNRTTLNLGRGEFITYDADRAFAQGQASIASFNALVAADYAQYGGGPLTTDSIVLAMSETFNPQYGGRTPGGITSSYKIQAQMLSRGMDPGAN